MEVLALSVGIANLVLYSISKDKMNIVVGLSCILAVIVKIIGS